MHFGEVSVVTAMLLDDRLSVLLDTSPQNLNQIIASRLTRIPSAIG